jgi:hypothetical protein
MATLLMLWWCGLVLGPDLPVLLSAAAAALVGWWMVRHRTAAAACAAIAGLTAAGLGIAGVVVVDRQVSGAPDAVAVLIGYLLATPIPALTACVLRPASLVSAPRSALLGSGILLLAVAPAVLAGAYGLANLVLVTAVTTAVGVIYLRHRRAGARLTQTLPTLHGWTDLRGRRTPDGTRIDRLLLAAGHAIVCTRLGDRPVTDRVALDAVHRAAAAAQAVGLAAHRVQPVILTTAAGKDTVRRHLVNDGDVAASAIVDRPDRLGQVVAQAPPRRPGHRRAVLAAALRPGSATTLEGRAG